MPGFHEVQFPPRIAYGARGRPAIAADVTELDSGQVETNLRWESARRSYDAGYGIKSISDINEVVAFYVCRDGVVNGFRWKDFADYTTAPNSVDAPILSDCDLGLGDGSKQSFQLRKKYVSGQQTKYRIIEKPVAGSVLVALDGSLQTENVDYTLDITTGIILFSSAPGTGVVVTAGCEFDVPVMFAPELVEGIEQVYEAFDSGTIPSIPILELKNPALFHDEFFYGGFIDHGNVGSNIIAVSDLTARHHRVKPADGAVAFQLPATTGRPKGGPWFYLQNDPSSAFTVSIVDNALAVLDTIVPGQTKTVNLGVDGGGSDLWITF